jgi:DNA polymerase III delta prime subunit
MSSIQIHESITNKLQYFIDNKKIPNIIFHGPSGSGKRTIVNNFVLNIYENDKELLDAYVMHVNCAHGKGIKFVRDDVKFFAKTHINIKGTGHFKTIILYNADKLTIDAQSALRRCIELFSHTTRFFIIVEDKYRLLKPILSRFCEIFVCEPIINGKKINLHKYTTDKSFGIDKEESKRRTWLKDAIKTTDLTDYKTIMEFSNKIYNLGYSGLDILAYVETSDIDNLKKHELLLIFHKVKREIRNEKLLMIFMFNFIFIRINYDLENISFM